MISVIYNMGLYGLLCVLRGPSQFVLCMLVCGMYAWHSSIYHHRVVSVSTCRAGDAGVTGVARRWCRNGEVLVMPRRCDGVGVALRRRCSCGALVMHG